MVGKMILLLVSVALLSQHCVFFHCCVLQYGRMFVETFLRQGMPVLDATFRVYKVCDVQIG